MQPKYSHQTRNVTGDVRAVTGTASPFRTYLRRRFYTAVGSTPTLLPLLLSTPSQASLEMRRRTFHIYLSLLAAVLLGTILVLSSFSYYLAIDDTAYLTEGELDAPDYDSRWNASQHGKTERIPRILHQTWKTDTLPARWKGVSDGCREMMPD